MIGPPDIAPARLFRLLIRRPYPMAPIAYRIRGAEHVQLSVRALSSLDEAEIADAAESWSEAKESRAASELIYRALLTPGGPAFASADDVGGLSTGEALGLAMAVRKALDAISPTYLRHDHVAWGRALKSGAGSGANWSTALALGGCTDSAIGMSAIRITERPDRYFGVPLAELVDAQWMVYRAAREVVEDLRKK